MKKRDEKTTPQTEQKRTGFKYLDAIIVLFTFFYEKLKSDKATFIHTVFLFISVIGYGLWIHQVKSKDGELEKCREQSRKELNFALLRNDSINKLLKSENDTLKVMYINLDREFRAAEKQSQVTAKELYERLLNNKN